MRCAYCSYMPHSKSLNSIRLPIRARILVVRRDNIGDLVCTTAAFAALRQQYPNAEIAALVNSYNAPVLRGNPNLDQVFVYQKLKHAGGVLSRFKALRQRFKLILQLRSWKPDVTVLAKSSYERHGLNFVRLIGAKNIIGYMPAPQAQSKCLPDIQIPTPDFKTLHEVEAVNDLLEPLGIADALGPLQIFPDPKAVFQLKQRLPAAVKRVALHVSAREIERRWGIDNFIALSSQIIQTQQEAQLLLFWSPGKADDPHHPGDDQAAAQLMQAVQSNRLIPMVTNTLDELIAGLSLCDLFIGTDGGALHLAVGLNKPCVALFENLPQKLNHWYPWQVPSRVVHGAEPAVSSIKLADVVAAVDELIKIS